MADGYLVINESTRLFVRFENLERLARGAKVPLIAEVDPGGPVAVTYVPE